MEIEVYGGDEYFSKTGGSLLERWNTCERGDWMLWFANKLGGCDKRLMTLVKGKCAETAIYLMKDKRSRDAVHAAIEFGLYKITEKTLNEYAVCANAASYITYVNSISNSVSNDSSADYAANAIFVTNANVNNDYNVAYDTAASYASYAGCAYASDFSDSYDYAASHIARISNQKLTADICRTILTGFIKTKLI